MNENRRNPFPWLLIGGGVILILAVFVWVILHQLAVPVAAPTPVTVEQVKRVSLVDAKTAFEAGKAVFLDVRDSNSYSASHIPGALNIALNDLTNRLSELNPSSWIITYCT
jgi:3-mercaptopyruvate sulfurtransferase SseA